MNYISKIISALGLMLTVIPSFFVLNEVIDIEVYKGLMLIGTFLWFGAAPFWIFKNGKNTH